MSKKFSLRKLLISIAFIFLFLLKINHLQEISFNTDSEPETHKSSNNPHQQEDIQRGRHGDPRMEGSRHYDSSFESLSEEFDKPELILNPQQNRPNSGIEGMNQQIPQQKRKKPRQPRQQRPQQPRNPENSLDLEEGKMGADMGGNRIPVEGGPGMEGGDPRTRRPGRPGGPGMGGPGMGGSEMGGPGMGGPGMGGPGMGGPGMGGPGMGGPGMGGPGMGGPGMGGPGMGGPGGRPRRPGQGGPGMEGQMGGDPGRRQHQRREPGGYPQDEDEEEDDGEGDTQKLSFNDKYSKYFEILFAIITGLLFINYFWGKDKILGYQEKWYSMNKEFFETNYSHLGDEEEYSLKNNFPIKRDSVTEFRFYATGRIYLKWMLINTEYKRRHDLIGKLTNFIIRGSSKDRITFEACIEPNSDVTTIFSLCRNKDIKPFRRAYQDIQFFTKVFNPDFISQNNLALLAEDKDLVMSIFENKNLFKLFQKVQDDVYIIYYSDRNKDFNNKCTICFAFEYDIDSFNGNFDKFSDINLFVHSFIDLVANIKFVGNQKKEWEKKRAEFDKIRTKENDEAKLEEAKRRALREKQMRQHQAQLEEERQKELRKQQLLNRKKK